jgi:hypothetical protein
MNSLIYYSSLGYLGIVPAPTLDDSLVQELNTLYRTVSVQFPLEQARHQSLLDSINKQEWTLKPLAPYLSETTIQEFTELYKAIRKQQILQSVKQQQEYSNTMDIIANKSYQLRKLPAKPPVPPRPTLTMAEFLGETQLKILNKHLNPKKPQ